MSGQYFEQEPSVASRPSTVELSLPDFSAQLQVDRGVFAARRVDAGTVELLRATLGADRPGQLLDLGCGYGAIACTIASRSPQSTVWAVDINERALDLTARNASALGLANVQTARPDDVPADMTFDGIWSNPPIRVGKEAVHDLLRRWVPRLGVSSAAWLVVQRHLGADSLAAWMSSNGWTVARHGSRKGYRILKVVAHP